MTEREEEAAAAEAAFQELARCREKLMQLARHIRNTDKRNAVDWGALSFRLLEDVQTMYPREYHQSVADR